MLVGRTTTRRTGGTTQLKSCGRDCSGEQAACGTLVGAAVSQCRPLVGEGRVVRMGWARRRNDAGCRAVPAGRNHIECGL